MAVAGHPRGDTRSGRVAADAAARGSGRPGVDRVRSGRGGRVRCGPGRVHARCVRVAGHVDRGGRRDPVPGGRCLGAAARAPAVARSRRDRPGPGCADGGAARRGDLPALDRARGPSGRRGPARPTSWPSARAWSRQDSAYWSTSSRTGSCPPIPVSRFRWGAPGRGCDLLRRRYLARIGAVSSSRRCSGVPTVEL